MPFLTLKTVKGLLSEEQKQYLMDKFTEILVEVEGGGNPDFKKSVWIQIDETEPNNWQMGELRPTEQMMQQFVEQRERMRK